MKTLVQNNEKQSLESWNNDDMPVCTGEMSECISIIFLGENKSYGIHCGGGVNEEEVERIKGFVPSNFTIVKTFVIFGFSYFDKFSCLFDATDAYRLLGEDSILLCSSKATIKSADKYCADHIWNKELSQWNCLNTGSSKCTIL